MTETHLKPGYDGTNGLISWSFDGGTIGVTTIRQEKHNRLNLYFGPYQKESEEL